MIPNTTFSAQRIEPSGHTITRLFTVKRTMDNGIAVCVCHKLRMRQYDGPDREAVLNDPARRGPYMPKVLVAHRANFKRRKTGVWTNTANAKPGGASRWVIVSGLGGKVAA